MFVLFIKDIKNVWNVKINNNRINERYEGYIIKIIWYRNIKR